MNKSQCRLTPLAASAMVAFIAIAVFALGESSSRISSLEEGGWLWKAWYFGPLIIAIAGVWAVWCVTKQVTWVRGIALCAYTLVVFLNLYVGWFGDYAETVWRTTDNLFIGFSIVAAMRLWLCGEILPRISALTVAAFGVVMFLGFIVLHDYSVVWWTMNPLTMLTALAFAAASFQSTSVSSAMTQDHGSD